MGNDEVYKGTYEKLLKNMDIFHLALSKTIEIFSDSENHYRNSMQISLDQVEYFNQADFMKLHQKLKSEAIAQVCKLLRHFENKN